MDLLEAAVADVGRRVSGAVASVAALLPSAKTSYVLGGAVASLLAYRLLKATLLRPALAPPRVPSWMPFLGCAKDFGQRPIDFLLECKRKYGPVFTFTMMGSDITFALGSEASAVLWNSQNDVLNAEDLYKNLTTPVFGRGVAYDVPHKIFSEQKQMAKEGLTRDRFIVYTGMIETEAEDYSKRWGDSWTGSFFEEMAKMVIFTATHCLHGKETRQAFDETVAQLYHDLDGGFSALGWLFPYWVPFPSFLKRDRAHKEMKKRFFAILDQRKRSGKVNANRTDLMETYMTTPYQRVEDGRLLNDDEVAGMMIALLMAGQHTSSTVSTWTMCFICSVPGLQEKLYQEQVAAFAKLPGPLTIEHMDLMPILHACVRETLRLRPPIMSIMRKCREDITIEADGRTYIVPKGGQLCVSPTVNGRLEEEWDQPMKFDYTRFLDSDANGNVKVTQAEQLTKGGKFKWVPFGAGRHRCIGFDFAQLQIRSIISTVLRQYTFELVSGQMPEIDYTTLMHTPKNSTIRVTRRK